MGTRGRKKKVNYFDDEQEMAVIQYGKSTNKEEKDYLFETYLKIPFQIMIESIIRRYPITLGKFDIGEVEKFALSHLIENMILYNPNKELKSGNKPKAYSYCQTIVRNFCREHSKKSCADMLINQNFDDYVDDVEKKDDYLYEIDQSENDVYEELLNNIIDNIEDEIELNKQLTPNDVIVGNAIINLLKNWKILFPEELPDNEVYIKTTKKYIKNKIMLILKEETRLESKDIRLSIKQFRSIYLLEKASIF